MSRSEPNPKSEIIMTVADYVIEFMKLERKFPNGARSTWKNADDTMIEVYGLHYEDLNEEQRLHFWYMATDYDTARECEELH